MNKLRLISAVQYERKGTSYYKGISNYPYFAVYYAHFFHSDVALQNLECII